MGGEKEKARKAELAKWLVKVDPEMAKHFKENEEWWDEEERKDPTNKKLKAEADKSRDANLVMAKEAAKLEAAAKAKAAPAPPVDKKRADIGATGRPVLQNMAVETANTAGTGPGGVKRQAPVLIEIIITYDNSKFVVGKNYQFAARGNFSDKTNRPLTGLVWSPAKSKVVSIDKTTGLALITDVGGETVTAQDPSSGVNGTFNVTTEGVHSKEMPYGTIHYYADEEEYVLPRLEKALKAYNEAEALDLKLNEAFIQLDEVEKRIKPLSEIKNEISKNATHDAKQQAKTAENALASLKISQHDLDDLQKRLSNGLVELHAVNNKLTAADKKDRAANLHALGEAQEKRLDRLIEAGRIFVKAVSEISSGHPPMEAEYDALVFLFKTFHENDLLKEAESLETEARKLDLDAEAQLYGVAKQNIKDLKDLLERWQPDVEKFEKTYSKDRDEAENAFDDNATPGEFNFADVVKGIKLAQLASKLAKQNQSVAYSAREAANALSHMDAFPPDGWKPANRPEAERILKGMYGDGERMFKESIEHFKNANAEIKKLKDTYTAAQDALVNSPGTGAPRPKKK